MIALDSADVRALLTVPDAIEIVEDAMKQTSNGRATLPLRHALDVGAPNMLGIMPGAMEDPACFGTKLISLFPKNPAHGHSSHLGMMVLFERAFGTPIAIMNAGLLTAIRTAAASAVATRALARKDAKILTIIGTGEQAIHHIAAICAVRDIAEVRLVGRKLVNAGDLAARLALQHPEIRFIGSDSAQKSVTDADIICTVTSSHETVLYGAWVPEGCHVNAVGASAPLYREIDQDLVTTAALYVDYRPSALHQARDIIEAIKAGKITEDHIIAEIGEVLDRRAPGRRNPTEITLYRSMGIAAQDLACAHHILERANKQGVGTEISIM
ncbi:MAG: ornithine cyclodeaminase family protein [Rhodobacterales bacterium]|nr:ornithine cyclodeaminase family protein [Rhodobacterales bacterium]